MKKVLVICGSVACLILLLHIGYNDYTFKIDSKNLIHQQSREIDILREKITKLQFTEQKADVPTIFVITPTYARPVQKAELIHMVNAFRQVPNLHWIIVEDSSVKTDLVRNVLREYPQNSTQLNIATPEHHKHQPKDKWWKKPRGVYQRNLALSWLRENCGGRNGVIYFADDDNTYSVDLFAEIRGTQRVSVLPVGLVGGVMIEKPRLKDGKVVGWEVGWGPERPFALDMAGMAINLQFFIQHPGVKFHENVKIGHSESEFLKQMVTLDQLEPVAINRVLVWHTRTEKPNLNREKAFKTKFGRASDAGIEV